MKTVIDSRVLNAIESFGFSGEYIGVRAYGQGHINDTYAAYFQEESGDFKRYLIQRINEKVFKQPEELMKNIYGVTNFLRHEIERDGGDPDRETLTLLKTTTKDLYFKDGFASYWRAYKFIEDTYTYQVVPDANVLYESGKAFGKFQKNLSTFPADHLFDTIPNFHNTFSRYMQFMEAVFNDTHGRVKDAQKEIDFVIERKKDTQILLDLSKIGELPIRVTHNDTKLNNVLIDRKTGKGICVVDLDTVMPGLSSYDFGDAIRFGANPAAEDEKDLSKVWMELSYFEAYVKGYLEEAGSSLTDKEIEMLPMGAKLMTFECGMRFLADHLAGDTYFKIHKENHNLDRARTQFKLVADMEKKWKKMQKIVEKYV